MSNGQLRELLGDCISMGGEKVEQYNTETPGSNTAITRPLRGSTEALFVDSKPLTRRGSFWFCNGQHWSDESHRYATVSRKETTNKRQLFYLHERGSQAEGMCIKEILPSLSSME